MTTLPITLPMPIPIPWPSPSPGVGTPAPSPGVQPSPSPGIPFPSPQPIAVAPAGGFPGLFKFPIDWKKLGALLFLVITVELVNDIWPEWSWPYVGLLLAGLLLVNKDRVATLFGGN